MGAAGECGASVEGCAGLWISPRQQAKGAEASLRPASHARDCGTASSRGGDVLQYAHPEGMSYALGDSGERDRRNPFLSQTLYPIGQGEGKYKYEKIIKINK